MNMIFDAIMPYVLILGLLGLFSCFWMAEQTRRSLAAKGGEDGVINALSWPWRLMLRVAGRA